MFLQKEQTRLQIALASSNDNVSKKIKECDIRFTDVKTRIEMLNNDPPPQKKRLKSFAFFLIVGQSRIDNMESFTE